MVVPVLKEKRAPHGTGWVGRRCPELSNRCLIPRIPLAKLFTDVLAQESNGIGSPARLKESGSPRRVDPDRTGNCTARCEPERLS